MLIGAVGGWARRAMSWAVLAGLGPSPPPRPAGITAMVRVRGDEEWIEPCLRSIRHFADEILVLDHGASRSTREALDAVAAELGPRLRVERHPELDFVALSNLGLGLARFRWTIRWDADFVAHTSGAGDIARLREHLLGLDARRHHLVHVPAVEVAGDLRHQFPGLRIRRDGQAVVWSRHLRYVPVRRTVPPRELAAHDALLRDDRPVRRSFESLRAPRWYAMTEWDRPAYFHVNVKSARHMLVRHFWLEWLEESSRPPTMPLEEYATRRALAEWGVPTLGDAERLYVSEYCRRLVPFDASTCGPYPELLLPFLAKPRYRVERLPGGDCVRRETSS
jgi:hypothetical protein